MVLRTEGTDSLEKNSKQTNYSTRFSFCHQHRPVKTTSTVRSSVWGTRARAHTALACVAACEAALLRKAPCSQRLSPDRRTHHLIQR